MIYLSKKQIIEQLDYLFFVKEMKGAALCFNERGIVELVNDDSEPCHKIYFLCDATSGLLKAYEEGYLESDEGIPEHIWKALENELNEECCQHVELVS